MTDQEALLAAVLAVPEDDAPRLQLADWLDEHGQPERAEFIRVQWALTRLPECKKAKPHPEPKDGPRCQWCALRRRERELWDAHRLNGATDPWVGPIKGFRYNVDWLAAHDKPEVTTKYQGNKVLFRFARGFVDEVRLTTAAFLGGPCGRCEGQGTSSLVRTELGGSVRREYECTACNGSGRVGGLAAKLFAAHPVTSVTLSDREPIMPGCRWAHRTGGTAFYELPRELFDLLPTRTPTCTLIRDAGLEWQSAISVRDYTTVDAALAALSRACVGYGRELVKELA